MLQKWIPRITTFLLWALAAGSATFWILQTVNAGTSPGANAAAGNGAVKSPRSPVAPSLPAQTPQTDLTPQVALALGAKNPATPTAASELMAQQARFQLMGVLAAGGQRGVALIATDGKSAKPYRVGARLDEGLHVLSVAKRSVAIGHEGQKTAAFELALPQPVQTLQTSPSIAAGSPAQVTAMPPGAMQDAGTIAAPQKHEQFRPQ